MKNIIRRFGSKPRPRIQNWLHKDRNGLVLPGKFSDGSYDALKHVPRSLKNPDSFYSRLLRVLHDARVNGRVWITYNAITSEYNKRFDENKRRDVIEKALSRFFVWGFVDFDVKTDESGRLNGRWALKADINITDVEDLLLRAKAAQELK